MNPIYLDHHATTPLDPRVLDAMMPFLREEFGNAASRTHAFGWRAEAAVDRAREHLADLLGAANAREIVFTSGATESNNLAIFGLAESQRSKRHLIAVVTEHPSVLDPCRALVGKGFELTELSVGEHGLIDLEELEAAFREDTFLVSVMAANNEIGVLQPISDIAAMCQERGITFHSDAAQAAGKVPLHCERDGIDLASVSGHKLYGPKGIGCLRVRRSGKPRIKLEPRQFGGGHEGGLRSGTLPVASIVGLVKALELCLEEREAEQARLVRLRDRLYERIAEGLPGRCVLNGDPAKRLAGNLNLSFPGVEGDRLILDLARLAVSSGSACSSANPAPSPVLRALGRSEGEAKASIRFGLGRGTSTEEIDEASVLVVEAVLAQGEDGRKGD